LLVRSDDPVARHFGLKRDDMLAVTSPSESGGQHTRVWVCRYPEELPYPVEPTVALSRAVDPGDTTTVARPNAGLRL